MTEPPNSEGAGFAGAGCGNRELLAYLARELVDEPEAVRVETEERDDGVVLVLHVAEGDVGKVIGRNGRIARALRTLVRAASPHDGRRVFVEIADPE